MVIVYSMDPCPYCKVMKAHLERMGVSFEERRVDLNPKHLKELEDMGYSSVPVTVINGQPVLGLNTVAVNDALAEAGYLS